MNYFAICETKNGEFECIGIDRKSLVSDYNNGNVKFNYKATIDKTVQQLLHDNETRKEAHKIVKFVDFVEHGNGYGASAHSKWAKERCEDAKKASFPIYDFEHPENGVEYY
jgi:hypothetical protein